MAFAERVQEARIAAGLTELQLSERSGLSRNTLFRRLHGTPGRFTIDELYDIADATGCDVEFFFTGKHPESEAVAS